jgi:ribosomal protein S18 acetylase RimI-like enzyme
MDDRSRIHLPERERVALADGRIVTVQPISAAARPLIAAAMGKLSPLSSRRRFFTPRFRLSDRELAQLTENDGLRHYAVGACRRAPDGTLEGLGIAHYVRDEDPRTAEVAITVIDEFQGLGLGKALLVRLSKTAFAHGIDRLHAIIMPDNDPVLALFRKYAPGSRVWREGDHLAADIPLEPMAAMAAA